MHPWTGSRAKFIDATAVGSRSKFWLVHSRQTRWYSPAASANPRTYTSTLLQRDFMPVAHAWRRGTAGCWLECRAPFNVLV